MSETGPDKTPKRYRKILPDRYRILELRTWRLLQGLDGDAVKLFLYCWCGPHSQPHGVLFFPREYMLVDLRWTPDQLASAWATLEGHDLLWGDGDLVIVVRFLESNAPANADVVAQWQRLIATLPDSDLFERLYRRASAWVSEEGLSWLAARLSTVSPTVAPTVSIPSPDGVDTGPTLRDQGSGLREQGSGLREQGSGGQEAGESEGRKHGGTSKGNGEDIGPDLAEFLQTGPGSLKQRLGASCRQGDSLEAAHAALKKSGLEWPWSDPEGPWRRRNADR